MNRTLVIIFDNKIHFAIALKSDEDAEEIMQMMFNNSPSRGLQFESISYQVHTLEPKNSYDAFEQAKEVCRSAAEMLKAIKEFEDNEKGGENECGV